MLEAQRAKSFNFVNLFLVSDSYNVSPVEINNLCDSFFAAGSLNIFLGLYLVNCSVFI